MKGGEGCFLVILFVIACISGDYVDRVKGEGFSPFRFSNFRLLFITAK